ncbi:MAG: universal stress protein [Pyrinomonadaceae bacterium]
MNVIFSTDGSKQSAAAMRVFDKLKLDDSDEITILSVVDMVVPASYTYGYMPDTSDIENAARAHASKVVENALDEISKKYSEVSPAIRTEIQFGSPEVRIVEKAEEIDADLIVMGSHGYSAWERLLLGSVSDSVVRHAPCSVLVVRK